MFQLSPFTNTRSITSITDTPRTLSITMETLQACMTINMSTLSQEKTGL
jgi:hypothetical protein